MPKLPFPNEMLSVDPVSGLTMGNPLLPERDIVWLTGGGQDSIYSLLWALITIGTAPGLRGKIRVQPLYINYGQNAASIKAEIDAIKQHIRYVIESKVFTNFDFQDVLVLNQTKGDLGQLMGQHALGNTDNKNPKSTVPYRNIDFLTTAYRYADMNGYAFIVAGMLIGLSATPAPDNYFSTVRMSMRALQLNSERHWYGSGAPRIVAPTVALNKGMVALGNYLFSEQLGYLGKDIFNEYASSCWFPDGVTGEPCHECNSCRPRMIGALQASVDGLIVDSHYHPYPYHAKD